MNKEYLGKLDSLISRFSKQKTEVLLNTKKKKTEKKTSYKPLLKYVFSQFEQLMTDFRKGFISNINFSRERVNEGFKLFTNEALSHLVNKQSRFKKLVKDVDTTFKKHGKRKDVYFSFIHSIDLTDLNAYKNMKGHKSKRELNRIHRPCK